ncbi:MAG: hypothetical protein ABSB78_05555 [Bacteroidota bacterium]
MDILNFARIIETELPKFAIAWENISENTTNLLHVAPIKSQEDKAAALQLKLVFSNLVSKIKDNIVSQKELLQTYSQMKGISKSMNAAAKRVIFASDQILVEYEKALAYSVKVIDLLDEKLIT